MPLIEIFLLAPALHQHQHRPGASLTSDNYFGRDNELGGSAFDLWKTKINLYKVLVTLLLINCPIARCRHPRLCRASAAGRGQAAVNQDCQVHMKLCHGHGVATRVTDNYNFARTNQETGRRGKVCIITKRLTSGKLLLCVSPI